MNFLCRHLVGGIPRRKPELSPDPRCRAAVIKNLIRPALAFLIRLPDPHNSEIGKAVSVGRMACISGGLPIRFENIRRFEVPRVQGRDDMPARTGLGRRCRAASQARGRALAPPCAPLASTEAPRIGKRARERPYRRRRAIRVAGPCLPPTVQHLGAPSPCSYRSLLRIWFSPHCPCPLVVTYC